MLAGGVDGRSATFLRRQIAGRPAGDRELGMARLIPILDPIAVLEPNRPVVVDENRSERLVDVIESLPGKLNTAT